MFPSDLSPGAAFRLLTTGLPGVAVMRLSDRLGPGENADDLARDMLDITMAARALLVTRNTKDVPQTDPVVRVPYTL